MIAHQRGARLEDGGCDGVWSGSSKPLWPPLADLFVTTPEREGSYWVSLRPGAKGGRPRCLLGLPPRISVSGCRRVCEWAEAHPAATEQACQSDHAQNHRDGGSTPRARKRWAARVSGLHAANDEQPRGFRLRGCSCAVAGQVGRRRSLDLRREGFDPAPDPSAVFWTRRWFQSRSRSRSAAPNAGWRSLVMAPTWSCRIRSRET
jgi:hypothetical protein